MSTTTSYYVNKNAQPNGDHEVHKAVTRANAALAALH